jgi:hypothetical protein
VAGAEAGLASGCVARSIGFTSLIGSTKGMALGCGKTHVLYQRTTLIPSPRTGAPYLARFSRDAGFQRC